MSTYQPQAPARPQAAGIATASVVLGAIGFIVGICAPIGLALGLVARGKAKRGEISPARITAGIIVSAISTALQALVLIGIITGLSNADNATTTTAQPVASVPASEPAPEEPAAAAPAPVPTETQAAPAPAPAETTTSEAPAPTATAEPLPVAPGIGQAVIAADVAYTVTAFDCGIAQVGSEYLNRTAQGEYCEATVDINNQGTRATTFNSSQAKAYIGDIEYAADGEASMYADDGNAFLTEINPGNTVTAKLYFDMPAGTRPDRLEIGGGLFSDGAIISVA
ncbi:DUF4352 domain-containing protein [Kineococcus radiotolerans]|uniref:DUF4352 domain-containing protein n=1 Tax=Kineococcus radiotolerans (strain ATCC BAA-149 / DSM 14245 / SRS30216) TaxID=266940 RepID=A6W8N9_KINRD|nr:DUF4352 domain-containing protein [Kineococcus radiotolerans]ABS03178.1 hypothetical protein Krad_1692 [Kineococcus radiotolerans SRS30216 = ATCC BAA-149]